MKKIFLAGFLSLAIILISGCAPQAKNNQPDNGGGGNENGPDQTALECAGMCEHISKICEEEINETKKLGYSMEESVYDEASCQLFCEADWDDNVKDCVSGADDCIQIVSSEPYCVDTEEEGEIIIFNDNLDKSCDLACRKYAKCASYGDDITAQNIQEAYITCVDECQHWSDTTKKCINKQPINQPADCLPMTICGIKEYQGLIN